MNLNQNVQASFRKVKADFLALKTSMSEWIRNLHSRQTETEAHVAELEARISQLEQKLVKLY